jgi:RND family efflux transporter MFP subunit
MSPTPRSSGRWLFTTLIAIVLILGVMGALTVLKRQSEFHALAQETELSSVPTVSTIHATVEDASDDLVLPGSLQAFAEASIFARTDGYVKRWTHDIGSRVKEGDLLAEIEAPEVDQQLSQAKAARDEINANLALAKSTADRWENLRKTDSVSQQEVDEKRGAYAQLVASLAAADANVKRLDELKLFQRVDAPFAGVITRRNVDIGTLVSSGTSGQQLFHLAQMDPIRVFVTVPEQSAQGVQIGLKSTIELPQDPGRVFEGKVARTSGSIDPATRTLLTEVDVPNPTGELLPGGYAQVHLQLKVQGPRLQVPVNALLFRAEGLRAVVVDDTHHLHLRALTIGRDYGTSLEVLQGLTKDDWIVLNPNDALEDGQLVHATPLKAAAPAATAATPAAPARGRGAKK